MTVYPFEEGWYLTRGTIGGNGSGFAVHKQRQHVNLALRYVRRETVEIWRMYDGEWRDVTQEFKS